MTNIVEFHGKEFAHVGKAPRERVIEPAAVADGLSKNVDDLDMLLVLGVTKCGQLYGACTHPDLADSMLLVERFRRRLLDNFGEDQFCGDEGEDGAA